MPGASQRVEMTILPNGADVTKSVLVQCPLLGAESVSATIDGTILLSATNDVEFLFIRKETAFVDIYADSDHHFVKHCQRPLQNIEMTCCKRIE